jgi:hypothetical protein
MAVAYARSCSAQACTCGQASRRGTSCSAVVMNFHSSLRSASPIFQPRASQSSRAAHMPGRPRDASVPHLPGHRPTGPATSDKAVTLWIENDVVVEQIHAADCADYLAQQALLRQGAEQVRQEDERARQLFPDAHARFQAALQALPAEQAADPFAAALAELVALQAEQFHGNGGFVVLKKWADVLDRHSPAGDR